MKGVLPGHKLPQEGRIWDGPVRLGDGRATCSCGQESPVLHSDLGRKRWHQEHKSRVLAGEPEPES